MPVQSMAESADSPTPRTKPYQVAEIAEMLNVHRVTIYRDIEAGRLKALRVGSKRGAIRVMPAALDAYLAQLEVQAVSAPAVAEVA